jgi:hypothetical protein
MIAAIISYILLDCFVTASSGIPHRLARPIIELNPETFR